MQFLIIDEIYKAEYFISGCLDSMNINNADSKIQLAHALEKTHIQELRFDKNKLIKYFDAKTPEEIDKIYIGYWFRIELEEFRKFMSVCRNRGNYINLLNYFPCNVTIMNGDKIETTISILIPIDTTIDDQR